MRDFPIQKARKPKKEQADRASRKHYDKKNKPPLCRLPPFRPRRFEPPPHRRQASTTRRLLPGQNSLSVLLFPRRNVTESPAHRLVKRKKFKKRLHSRSTLANLPTASFRNNRGAENPCGSRRGQQLFLPGRNDGPALLGAGGRISSQSGSTWSRTRL